MFAAKEDAIEIDRQAASPGFELHILQFDGVAADPSAVQQNVEMSVLFDDLGANPLPLRLDGGVVRLEAAGAAGLPDCGGDILAFDLLDVRENDRGALCRHQLAGGLAEPRGAAG